MMIYGLEPFVVFSMAQDVGIAMFALGLLGEPGRS